MALAFLTNVNKEVACVAAFDPNGSSSVKLGSGIGEGEGKAERITTPGGKEITCSKNIHVYKLTKVARNTTEDTRKQIEALKSLHASTVSTLSAIKDEGALGEAVDAAKEAVKDAKARTGYDRLSETVDAAARGLAESVEREVKGRDFAQGLADDITDARHNDAIGDYAKFKGKEMQGEAELWTDEGRKAGRWSQGREDVTVWIDWFKDNGCELRRGNVEVDISKYGMFHMLNTAHLPRSKKL